MPSMTLDYLRQRKGDTKNKTHLAMKRAEGLMLIELREMLVDYLEENDKIMVEVQPEAVGAFLNVLTDTFMQLYEYEQIESNKFIFYSKEIYV